MADDPVNSMHSFIADLSERSVLFENDLNYQLVQMNKSVFFVSKNLIAVKKEISAKNKIEPEYIGELLAETKKDIVHPTLVLVEKLSAFAVKKVYVSKDAEWLFLCGKDLFTDSIEKIEYLGEEVRKRDVVDKKVRMRGLALVFNSKNECLGYGEIVNRGMIFLKNKLDKGDYLRREMN